MIYKQDPSPLPLAHKNEHIKSLAKAVDEQDWTAPLAPKAVFNLLATISEPLELDTVLAQTCRAVVEQFGVEHSAIVEFTADFRQGIVRAEYPSLEFAGSLSIPIHDVPIEQILLATQKPVLVLDARQERASLGALADLWEAVDIQSSLLVPVFYEDELLASFSLDCIGRTYQFSEAEITLCKQFAAQVGIAIRRAQRFAAVNERIRQMEWLYQSAVSVTASPNRQAIFNDLVVQAHTLLNARRSGIKMVHAQKNCLEIVASSDKGQSLTGRCISADDGASSHLLRHNMDHLIVNDYTAWPEGNELLAEELGLQTVLVVPLHHLGKTFGTLYVEDELGRDYSEEDITLLKLFANYAGSVVANQNLVQEVQNQRAHFEQLVAHDPNAIIATNSEGRIIELNKQAEAMLGYRRDELINRGVATIFVDRAVMLRLAKKLEQATCGCVKRQHLMLRHKNGEPIPVQLTALQTDMPGSDVSVIGYIEDMRKLQTTEQRMQLLLQINKLLANADSLETGLQGLASQIVSYFAVNCCRVLLLDPTKQFLLTKAAAAVEGLVWEPGVGQETAVTMWPCLSNLDTATAFRFLSSDNEADRPILAMWSERLELTQMMQSLLLITLRKSERALGLFVLGAFATHSHILQDSQQFQLMNTIAEQTAVHVDRLQLIEREQQRIHLLEQLDEMSRRIAQPREFPKLLQEVIAIGVELTGCEAGGLYINNHRQGLLQLTAVFGLPEELIGHILPHSEGLIGKVACTGKMQITNDYGNWTNRAAIFADAGFETVVGTPLKRDGVVEAVLFVVDRDPSHRVQKNDLDVLKRFAMRAAIAQQTSQLIRQEQRTFHYLHLLQRINDVIGPEQDLQKVIQVLLTGITADYGLEFNRAAIFLLDESSEWLVGAGGIGQLEKADATEDWADYYERGLADFGNFLIALEQGDLQPTPLEEKIQSVRIRYRPQSDDPFAFVLREQRPFHGTAHTILQLPEQVTAVFRPGAPLLMVPLMMAEEPIGVLLVDNKFTQATITPENVEMLLTYANTAAVTIAQTRRLNEAENALKSFAKAGEALISMQDFEQAWHDIVEQTRQVANASQVRLILLDKQTGAIRSMFSTEGLPDSQENLVRPDGLSMQIMRCGKARFVEDVTQLDSEANPVVYEMGFRAILGLPVMLDDGPIGVMWLYDKEPRQWSSDEMGVVQLFVNQVSVAYENARQIRELQHQHQAATLLAGSSSLQEVLRQTAASAMTVLEADSVVIWSYDPIRRSFVLEDSLALNFPDSVLKQFYKPNVRPGGGAEAVMQQKWLPVHNLTDLISYPFLGQSTRKLLYDLGVRSFQGIALQVDAECLGIIYLNYNSIRQFTEDERKTAVTFGNYAALALKKVRLVRIMQRAQRVSQIVAKLTTLNAQEVRLNDTLKSIVEGTRSVINCDAVTLYAYDQSKEKFFIPPTYTGVIYPDKAYQPREVKNASSIFQLVKQDGWHIVNDVTKDDLFLGSDFIKREQIDSYIGLPLRVSSFCVGVMFINYRTPHMFLPEELENIEMFADQAAVAIYNSQLYTQAQQQAKTLKGLQKAAKIVTSSLDINEILFAIVEQAAILTGLEGKKASSSHICLVYGRRLHFQATYPRYHLERVQNLVGTINLDGEETIGICGRAVKQQKYQLVSNVCADTDYRQYLSSTRSELAVPILSNGKVLGVIIVEHNQSSVFGEDDVHVLSMLADYAATAIENARLHDQLSLVAKMLEKASSSLDISHLLRSVCLYLEKNSQQNVIASIRLYNADCKVLEFKPEWHHAFFDLINDPMQKGHFEQEVGEGVCGYVAQHRQPVTLVDVDDPNAFPEAIKRVETTRSAQAVPICYGKSKKLLGVLHVQSPEVGAFDEDNQRFLELLADQLAIAIHKAQEYEELKRTKGLVGSRTALVWMGMASNAWRHSITGDAATIRNMVSLLNLYLKKTVTDPEQRAPLEEKLSDIQRLASRIVERPITPPLSQEEGLEQVDMNALLQERLYQLWEDEPYKSVEGPILKFQATEASRVMASPEWLRRAFDLLIDNAVEAMESSVIKRLTVETRLHGGRLEIGISDTGHGISDAVLATLWQNDRPQSTKEDHLGRGLLMVQAILETYGGTIQVGETSEQGTTMLISLPLAKTAVFTPLKPSSPF